MNDAAKGTAARIRTIRVQVIVSSYSAGQALTPERRRDCVQEGKGVQAKIKGGKLLMEGDQ
jgi:hypothetical protein